MSILDAPRMGLSGDIFENGKVKRDFRNYVLTLLKRILSGYSYNKVYLCGSMVSYNYTEDSDIDIHFDVKGVEKEKIEDLIDNAEVFYYGKHRIEFYFDENLDDEVNKGGVYDLVNDRWLSKPVKYSLKNIPVFYFIQIASIFIEALDRRINEFNYDISEYVYLCKQLKEVDVQSSEYEDINKRLDFLESELRVDRDSVIIIWRLIKSLRAEGFKSDDEGKVIDNEHLSIKFNFGNESLNNLIYKYIEKIGLKEIIRKYKNIDLDKFFRQVRGFENKNNMEDNNEEK